MLVVAWFVGLIGLVVTATLATARGRARPDDVVARPVFVAIALGYAVVVGGVVWAWGGARADAGRDDRLRAGAQVELALRAVTVPLDGVLTIGHDRAATVRLPGPGPAEVARVDGEGVHCVVQHDCDALHVSLAGKQVTIAPATHILVTAGDALRLGRADEPVPALATWELAAPTAEVVAIPPDPTDCATWMGHATVVRGGCDVTLGAFSFTAIPLVPDPDAVTARATRVAIALGAPLVVTCLVLATLARSRRRTTDLARISKLAALGAALAALACWRLLWAYRIDMLKDLAPAGARVADNQLAAALLGATIAALSVRRAWLAVVAWAGWLAVGWFALGLGPAHVGVARAAMIGLSFAAALAPRVSAIRLPKIPPDVILFAIAGAAVAAHTLAPRGVLGKLVLAYALVLAGHAALRAALSRTPILYRARMVVALGVAVLAVASYDTGVTLAVAGVGLAVAMLVAGHDAIYDDSNADKIGILEREHARLLVAHAAVAIAVAAAVTVAALVATDASWLTRATDVACQAPLVAVALFVIAAILARVHRRTWLPHIAAALAALVVWGARADVLERATAGHGVGSERVAAIVEPGYALLKDGQRFAANASAWREAALPPASEVSAWQGEGLFGARIVDPGVIKSVENDYLPVLVAREGGVGGIAQTTLLLLAIVAAIGAFASAGLGHASRAHRARWLVAVVLGVLCVYQPLASLGVLPLTGISWPGLGIDSPSDLWLFVIAIAWCAFGGPSTTPDDARIRGTPRVIRARRVAAIALAATALAGGTIVARSAATALARVPGDDARISAALAYAGAIACPWRDQHGTLDELVPASFGATPTDPGTVRFDHELRSAWLADRPAAVAAAQTCTGSVTHWRFTGTPEHCTASFRAGGPELRLELSKDTARCTVVRDDIVAIALRGRESPDRGPRIRVVGEALGEQAADAGELLGGGRIVRLRTGAPALALADAMVGLHRAGSVSLGSGASIDASGGNLTLHGDAELFLDVAGHWRRVARSTDVRLDRIALVIAGPPSARVVVQVRPARAWPGGVAVTDTLLADDADRGHRTYPYGAALPELGWVNPYDVDHSLGLDGWVHAGVRHPGNQACGTLAPPDIPRDRVCTPSPLDGVLECRVSLQPELAATLAELADHVIAAPKKITGHDSVPTRFGFVVMRGDTGEILAQSSTIPGRPPLAYAPVDRDAEVALMELREARGESDRERAEWNLPIAVGSTFKPILARAAELAIPELASLTLSASGHASGCRSHHGASVEPLLGHCPPSSLAGDPSAGDVHDFLEHSLNWFQAAIGLVGLGAGGHLARGDAQLTLAELAATDIAGWATKAPLQISDATGPIIVGHSIVVDGVRRTPMWTGVERLLGRPLCTLGDRGKCEHASERADVCAARGLPITAPSRDLRYLVSLGPDRLDVYADDRAGQARVPVREYFQLLRGSGAHPIGSLAQLADAFSRVVYGDTVAASWFPAPASGKTPAWSCAASAPRSATVLGAGGGLCAVVTEGGTAHGALDGTLADKRVVVYAAKTGTTDSLADLARSPERCKAWNATHEPALQLTCGKRPPDDSLFVIAFGVVTPTGTIPITLAIHEQRAGLGAAARTAPQFIDAIASYLGAR